MNYDLQNTIIPMRMRKHWSSSPPNCSREFSLFSALLYNCFNVLLYPITNVHSWMDHTNKLRSFCHVIRTLLIIELALFYNDPYRLFTMYTLL